MDGAGRPEEELQVCRTVYIHDAKGYQPMQTSTEEHKLSIMSHMDGANCISDAAPHEASLAHYGIRGEQLTSLSSQRHK